MVSGRVQGVYYRTSARDAARALGLTGWVRNVAGGRVEAVIEGDEEGVREMIDWCREGPPSARVDDIEVTWERPTGEFDAFHVTRF